MRCVSPNEPLRTRLKEPVALSLLLSSLLAVGCGPANDMARVKGTITLNGQPLEHANIEFRPTADEGAPSSGQTDAGGRYELMYTFDTPGALPGEYIVSIRTAGTFFDDDCNELEREEQVPAKYNTQTELRRTVEPGRNRIDFDL